MFRLTIVLIFLVGFAGMNLVYSLHPVLTSDIIQDAVKAVEHPNFDLDVHFLTLRGRLVKGISSSCIVIAHSPLSQLIWASYQVKQKEKRGINPAEIKAICEAYENRLVFRVILINENLEFLKNCEGYIVHQKKNIQPFRVKSGEPVIFYENYGIKLHQVEKLFYFHIEDEFLTEPEIHFVIADEEEFGYEYKFNLDAMDNLDLLRLPIQFRTSDKKNGGNVKSRFRTLMNSNSLRIVLEDLEKLDVNYVGLFEKADSYLSQKSGKSVVMMEFNTFISQIIKVQEILSALLVGNDKGISHARQTLRRLLVCLNGINERAREIRSQFLIPSSDLKDCQSGLKDLSRMYLEFGGLLNDLKGSMNNE